MKFFIAPLLFLFALIGVACDVEYRGRPITIADAEADNAEATETVDSADNADKAKFDCTVLKCESKDNFCFVGASCTPEDGCIFPTRDCGVASKCDIALQKCVPSAAADSDQQETADMTDTADTTESAEGSCNSDLDCASGNICEGTAETCNTSTHKCEVRQAKSCDDGDSRTNDYCDPQSQVCKNPLICAVNADCPNGQSCNTVTRNGGVVYKECGGQPVTATCANPVKFTVPPNFHILGCVSDVPDSSQGGFPVCGTGANAWDTKKSELSFCPGIQVLAMTWSDGFRTYPTPNCKVVDGKWDEAECGFKKLSTDPIKIGCDTGNNRGGEQLFCSIGMKPRP